ncbi:MAG: hypothetical protein H6Q34_88 [Deltaproteobacteria bacterium]|nr:hypothetical protein [Deltaproteobacteria bacterium]
MRNERRRREEGARGGGGWSPIGLGLSIVLHVLAIGFIFVAPHPLPAPHPTAYTVEIVDPSALGGKLLAGPIGGAVAKPPPPPKAPPQPPEPPPPPPPEEPPPPEQVAKAEEPPPPVPEDENDPDAIPLATAQATPVATVTVRVEATPRPTKEPTARPTARPTMRPTPRASATAVASARPKVTATPETVIAKKSSPAPAVATRRPDSRPATPGAEVNPKAIPTSAPADDLDGKLAAAIKGVEAKVEKSGSHGVGGTTGPGGGMGGTERTLSGPAGIGGEGPGGGGTVRGLEFVVYYNQMLNRIKERWTWVGTRSDLRVTVQFSILPSGEIANIRLVERSGDQSYDASVERAVKSAGPLPPPPEAYRSDFADVELKFRPADLQR